MKTNKNNHHKNTRKLVITGLLAAIICIVAPWSISIGSYVPISLGTMIICLVVYLFGTTIGTSACAVYILLGIVGLPVFSGFMGGVARIAGPTGGYIVGFLVMSLICGLFNKIGKGNIFIFIIGMALGIAADYICGTLWFMISMNMSLVKTLVICVVPFIVGDVCKIVFVAVVGPIIKKSLNRLKLD